MEYKLKYFNARSLTFRQVNYNVFILQSKDGSIGFARGSKGFFAMGNLNNVQFEVGSLPDGEYCDVIHNCEQKIHVSGGRATFNKAQGNDPVAAICVGCQ